MRNLILTLAFLFSATSFAGPVGTQNQVFRMPNSSSKIPDFGQIVLSSSAAVTGSLGITNGGTGAATQSGGFDALSPMTSVGDLIRGGTSGTGTRLGIGSTNQFLSVVGGIPTWTTTLGIANGGTGQTTQSTAFNALSPMTTLGDLIIGGSSGAGTRLGIGSTGQVLTVSAGSPIWTNPITVVSEAQYTPTFAGFGTVSSVNITHRRFGRRSYIEGYFIAGTVTNVVKSMTLPSGETIDTTTSGLNRGNTTSAAGHMIGLTGWDNPTEGAGYIITATGTSTGTVYWTARFPDNTTQLTPSTLSVSMNSGAVVFVKFDYPVSGWTDFN